MQRVPKLRAFFDLRDILHHAPDLIGRGRMFGIPEGRLLRLMVDIADTLPVSIHSLNDIDVFQRDILADVFGYHYDTFRHGHITPHYPDQDFEEDVIEAAINITTLLSPRWRQLTFLCVKRDLLVIEVLHEIYYGDDRDTFS